MGEVSECSCPRLALGLRVLEQRNWNPDCCEHGTTSAWWNSTEQRAEREKRRQALTEMQRQARAARERTRDKENE